MFPIPRVFSFKCRGGGVSNFHHFKSGLRETSRIVNPFFHSTHLIVRFHEHSNRSNYHHCLTPFHARATIARKNCGFRRRISSSPDSASTPRRTPRVRSIITVCMELLPAGRLSLRRVGLVTKKKLAARSFCIGF